MESSNGDCLGFIETSVCNNSINVDFLETAPAHKNEYSNGKSKYVGETLLSFITKLAQELKKKCVYLETAVSARDFYVGNCFFQEKAEDSPELTLYDDNFDKLIEQNEKHTGKSIMLIS